MRLDLGNRIEEKAERLSKIATDFVMVATSPYYEENMSESANGKHTCITLKRLTLEFIPAREEPSEAIILLIVTVYASQ